MELTRSQARNLIQGLRERGRSSADIRQALSSRGITVSEQKTQEAVQQNAQSAIAQQQNDPSLNQGFDTTGFLKDTALDALGTAGEGLDFLGGAVRAGGAAVSDLVRDEPLLKEGELAEALIPFDGKPAVGGADLLRRIAGVQGTEGSVESSDLAGFALDTVTDPLTFLTLGALPAAKAAGKGLRQIPRLLGRLTGTSGEVVDNFIKNNKNFRKLSKLSPDELAETQTKKFTKIVEDLDSAQFERASKVSKEFGDKIASKKTVDISGFKDELKQLKNDFSIQDAVNNDQLQEAIEVTKLIDDVIVKGTGRNKKEIADELTGERASKLIRSLKGRITGQDATTAEKIVAGRLNKSAKKISKELVGDNLNKRFQKEVIDRNKQLKRLIGDKFKVDSAGRANKLQNTFKSGTRSDNFVLRDTLNSLSKTTGTDLAQEALDTRTLDLVSGSSGRLKEANSQGQVLGNIIGGALNGGFKGSAALNSAVTEGLGGKAFNSILQRLGINTLNDR